MIVGLASAGEPDPDERIGRSWVGLLVRGPIMDNHGHTFLAGGSLRHGVWNVRVSVVQGSFDTHDEKRSGPSCLSMTAQKNEYVRMQQSLNVVGLVEGNTTRREE